MKPFSRLPVLPPAAWVLEDFLDLRPASPDARHQLKEARHLLNHKYPGLSASDADGSIFEPFQQALSIQESFMLNQMPGRAEAGYPAATQDATDADDPRHWRLVG